MGLLLNLSYHQLQFEVMLIQSDLELSFCLLTHLLENVRHADQTDQVDYDIAVLHLHDAFDDIICVPSVATACDHERFSDIV